jgi:hypothetical protein
MIKRSPDHLGPFKDDQKRLIAFTIREVRYISIAGLTSLVAVHESENILLLIKALLSGLNLG